MWVDFAIYIRGNPRGVRIAMQEGGSEWILYKKNHLNFSDNKLTSGIAFNV